MKILLYLVGVLFLAKMSESEICWTTPEPPCTTVADIVFVIDASSSIGAANFAKMLQFAKNLVDRFVIGPTNVRFGAMVFSRRVKKLFDLCDYPDADSIKLALSDVHYMNSSTYMHRAFKLLDFYRMFSVAKGGRENAKKLIVLLTDGNPNRVSKTIKRARILKDQGITIMSVAIGHEITMRILRKIVSHRNLIVKATNFNVLGEVEQRVVDLACKEHPEVKCNAGFAKDPSDPTQCIDIDECEQNPCQHNCTNTEGSYVCTCHMGYVVNANDSHLCDKLVQCSAIADIILVIDSSISIGEENYEKMFDFIRRLVSHFTVGPNDARFGALIFSTTVQKLFDLKDHTTEAAVLQALTDVPYLKARTNMHTALRMIVDPYDMFGTQNGGRDNVPDLIILVSDGDPNFVMPTVQRAEELKDMGVTIMGVAIGDELDLDTFAQIVSSPNDVVASTGFDSLTLIEDRAVQIACQVASFCEERSLSSWNYEYESAVISKDYEITSMTVLTKHSRSPCTEDESYGFKGHAAYVDKGCRATFVFCFSKPQPDSPKVKVVTIKCESWSYKDNSCDAGGKIKDISIAKQLSKSPCKEGETYKALGNTIHVADGCRAEFHVSILLSAQPPPPNVKVVTIKCESWNYKDNSCDAGGEIQEISIAKQLSKSPCKKDETYKAHGNTIHVADGCRAEFRVSILLSAQPPPPMAMVKVVTIKCESWSYKDNSCDAGGKIQDISIAKQRSRSPCKEGETYKAHGNTIHVADGCRAEFRVSILVD